MVGATCRLIAKPMIKIRITPSKERKLHFLQEIETKGEDEEFGSPDGIMFLQFRIRLVVRGSGVPVSDDSIKCLILLCRFGLRKKMEFVLRT